MAGKSSSSSSLTPVSSSGDEVETLQDALEGKLGIKPYMFEPDASSSDSEEERDDDGEGATGGDPRTGNSDWCTCGRCEAQDQRETSFCCRECPQLDAIRLEEEGIKCCTEHGGLQRVATDVHVLRAAFNSNRRKYGQRRGRANGQAWSENEKNRHVAYGNVVALAWGYLGRTNRVPLPACVLRLIREAFPSATGVYTGYKEAGLD